jgi:hypothetical protein
VNLDFRFSFIYLFIYLGKEVSHQKCVKFQRFLLEEFGRLFRMFTDMGKKETEANEKLLRALEKCDALEYELEKAREELAEYHFYEFDL